MNVLYILGLVFGLPPEVSLSQLLTTPTGFEIMEGLRKTVEVLISALEEGEAANMPPEALNEIFEAAERAKNEETREALT